ncbi:MAG: alpha/beta fold hydrolase [Candidatus Dojkabacteria bacterium]
MDSINISNSNNRKFTAKKIPSLIFFLILIAIPVYFAYKTFSPRVEIFDTNEENKQEEQIEQEEDTEEFSGPHYEEMYEDIGGEIAYIAVPTNIDKKKLPTIVVYSHGSNTRVTMDTEEEFMKDLQKYGEIYTEKNLIFAASNQHGENWGNQLSIQDTLNMIEWIKDKYETKEKIYMVGFSMGGLPTLNFATTHPELVSKIALLAPTTRASEWNSERVEKISEMKIQIWHGTADVNVGYSLSTTFVNKLQSLGREIPLITLEGKTHWDMEEEYMDDVLEFLINS